MRWIVLLITTVSLLSGACTSSEVRRADLPASVKLTKSLPAASVGSHSELRLPAFALPASADAGAPRVAVAEQRTVVRRRGGWVRPAHVVARGPPRG